MEDEDGYTNIDPRRRETYTKPHPDAKKKDALFNLLWWKIGFSISLTIIVILTVVLIVIGVLAPEGSSGTAFLPYPVIFPTNFHDSENNNMMDHLSKLPRKNSCTSNGSSCLYHEGSRNPVYT
ncbi:uncharacterized protein LOC100563045 isoform X2 [Anolis carolinensis]|uniref:uncharacterized protein LOC100563045 isoform X2 n=1 Tax=Anolis carolinensis TaxID=28377 RepID=UPI000462533A|nr:PREDICTED: uncharacterized protein LOC100563045 isoform X2 [Anolis carolinensis]|eukprot:XP_008118306.1 PREDICTED: uncharacterized protein LOC100563045 isoform X2 [Anolis carolinensis]